VKQTTDIPLNKRLNRERETVQKMVALYCHAQHKTSAEPLCGDCQVLSAYAIERINGCPFGASKPTCDQCPIHCYRPEMREKIRQVMRYAGPRMVWHHPRLALLHVFDRLL